MNQFITISSLIDQFISREELEQFFEIRLPRAPIHGERSGIKLHVAYTPETGMKIEVKETIGRVHDGPAGVSLANASFILMGDCVYGKHAQLDDYERQDQRFVIRFRENVKCHRPQGLQCFIPTHSNVTDDITCQLGTEQSRTTHRFRVVTFNDHKGHPIRVATNMATFQQRQLLQ
ncbi:transposase [Salisediminibacterium selenitireducens]|uniref:transposase n=1 Tax=Salisediminibacterium selenitireducens TaxID=85683 RepID=UPI00015F9254|nr:transposase [Salisediminibacterium selenitireducens]